MNDDKFHTDDHLIQLFNSRAEEAISKTAEKYGRYLWTIANNILHNQEDSEECVNDVYYLIWKHIPPDCPQSFVAYITTITRNRALSKRRMACGKSLITCALPIDELEAYLGCSDTLEQEYDNLKLQDLFDRFVRSLSSKDRYIFECRYYCSDSVSSIAKALRISEVAVYKRIHKIKQKLKKHLETGGYYDK